MYHKAHFLVLCDISYLLNDLLEKPICKANHFAHDVIQLRTTIQLYGKQKQIDDCSVRWKMVFNPDIKTSPQDIILTNRNFIFYNTVTFSRVGVKSVDSHKNFHKHYTKLIFNKHHDGRITKRNVGMGIITYLHNYLVRKRIYKWFIRSRCDYNDIMHHKSLMSFQRVLFRERLIQR